MVNTIYGLLADSAITSDVIGYRYSNYRPTTKQLMLIDKLFPSDCTEQDKALFIDFIIGLLSCSPYWPKVVRELDLDNTYDTSVIDKSNTETLSFNPMQRLIDWERTTNVTDERFPYIESDPVIDKICAKIFCILGMK